MSSSCQTCTRPLCVPFLLLVTKVPTFSLQDVHGISTSSYATKWYITLFANSVPFSTQLRLWDGLLLEGLDFLVVTSLAIIWCFRGASPGRR